MERLNIGEAIRIPTGGESDKYYVPGQSRHGAVTRSPSIVVIENSPSPPKRTKLNRFQEVPRIPTKSKIPVLQRSSGPATYLQANIYRHPVSASSHKTTSTRHSNPSVTLPSHRMVHENTLGPISTNKALPVLPAINVGAIGAVASRNAPSIHGPIVNSRHHEALSHSDTDHVTLPPERNRQVPPPGQYYHVSSAKPVFQMKAEYNNMLQKYASNVEQQGALPAAHAHHHHHSARVPCTTCGGSAPPPALLPRPNPGMESSYVQQWLVDPAHPYQLPAALPPPHEHTRTPVVSAIPLVLRAPSASAAHPASSNKVSSKSTADVPIRYTQAPTQQIVSKSSGKLLSPEDALKRTLKRKKIPPLTKRNSLRSIFSDASSNLQKIEEMEEDRESDERSGRSSHHMEVDDHTLSQKVTF